MNFHSRLLSESEKSNGAPFSHIQETGEIDFSTRFTCLLRALFYVNRVQSSFSSDGAHGSLSGEMLRREYFLCVYQPPLGTINEKFTSFRWLLNTSGLIQFR